MGNTPLKYPDLPPALSGRLNWRVLGFFGTGAIIASVTIGSGETLFASRGGAIFGYSLLWCFVLGAVMKGIQVYTAARHLVLTGEHPMTHWGRLPGPKNWVPLLIGTLSLICFPFWLAGLPRIFGEIINWIFGLGAGDPEQFIFLARVWGTVAVLLAVTLTWIQSYSVLERIQTFLVGLLLLSVMVSCVAVNPDWLQALTGTVVPSFPEYQPWVAEKFPSIAERPPWIEIMVYLGAIGGGTYDYIGHIGLLREKKWGAVACNANGTEPSSDLVVDCGEDNIQRAKRWLIAPRIDTGISFLCVFLFTVCFVLLGATVLHPNEIIPSGRELLVPQAQFLTRFHPSFLYLYQMGIFVAFWGTIYGAYELYVRTTHECLRPLRASWRNVPLKSVRIWVLLYCGLGGIALMWSVEDPIKIVTPAAIVGGVFTCGLWCFAMLWTDRHILPKPLQMKPVLWVFTALSGLVLTVLGVKGIWDYVARLL